MLAEEGRPLSCLPGKRGELKLCLGVKDGRTVINSVYNRVPLKIAKPFYLEPDTGEIFIYQMNPAGGMVQGDDYYQEIELEPGAQAFFTTQSSAKIYRTPESYTRQVNVFRLGEGTLLEYFPDPVIPFAGSRFVGDTEVRLEKGATAMLAEMVTPGRAKMGEIFQYDFYKSRTRIYREGELILWDNWRLTPGNRDLRALGMYDGYTHQGNFFIMTERVSQALADKIHERVADFPDILAGASLTAKYGIVVRLLGLRADRLEKAVTACWDLARQELIGRPKPRIRKY